MSSVNPSRLRQTIQDKSLIFAYVTQASLDKLMYVASWRIGKALFSRTSLPWKWFTEIYFVGHLFLQLNYLRQFGATFSEHFFGLKRTSLKNKGSTQLSNKEILLSLLFSSVYTYAMEKMEQTSQNLQNKSISFVNAVNNILLTVTTTRQFIKFLSGNSDVVSPVYKASGVKLEYSNEAPSQAGNFREIVSQALQNGLGLSAFFLQFCQWWQTERSVSGKRVAVPPPPVTCEYDVGQACLLCEFKENNVTVLSISGYIFCNKCITDFVEKYKKCPITNILADPSKLIQLQE